MPSTRTPRNPPRAATQPSGGGTPPPRSRNRSQPGLQTRNTILDVAERICAEQGFEGLSVRAISEVAKVNVAAITYHFGGKNQLFEEMFKRRVVPLNERRLALLDSAMADPSRTTLQDIVHAFVEPPMRLTSVSTDSGNPAVVVMQFLSRVFAMPGESEFLGVYYEPVRSRFVLALKHVLPQQRLEDLIWGYNLMVGGIIYAMGGIQRMERPPLAFAGTPLQHAADLDEIVARMTRFFAAGLSQPLKTGR